jgi:L-lactate utilization protein LutB
MPYKDMSERRQHHRIYMQRWYRENKSKHIALVGRRRTLMRARFQEMKRSLACTRCGEQHVACIQFHHIDGSRKEFTISAIRSGNVSARRLAQELEKCEVVCANCHLKIHWQMRQQATGR